MLPRDTIDERTFFEKYGVGIVVGVVVMLVVAGGVAFYVFKGKIPPPKKPEEIMVTLLPPPLPPPPPPPPPPPQKPPPPEQKMVQQPKVDKPTPKPKEEAKIDKPPGPPGPKASGPPSDEGIGGTGGSGNVGDGDGGGSKYGWYAAEVQERIADALRQNDKTRDLSLRVKVRIWSDSNGRIVRVELSGSSGDPAVDSALKNDVLTGLQLQDPPPQDMPMPIVMMIHEQRPS
jgi:outer membrane biosynthesis protein TonB